MSGNRPAYSGRLAWLRPILVRCGSEIREADRLVVRRALAGGLTKSQYRGAWRHLGPRKRCMPTDDPKDLPARMPGADFLSAATPTGAVPSRRFPRANCWCAQRACFYATEWAGGPAANRLPERPEAIEVRLG